MPKLPINYENACIYQIVCKDVNITEKYIGSTTNLIQRRRAHKTVCCNDNAKAYNFYLYQFIRENGSFDNWDIVLIEKVIDCKDKENLHKRERYYIELLKAELNKAIPTRSNKEWYEDNKDILVVKRKNYYQDNKERISKQSKEYYQDNKEKSKEYVKNNSEKYKEYQKEYQKTYYQKNKIKPI
jgi:hypothetical protein